MDSNSDTSVSTLVNSAITDAQSLVRQQIELAKAEVTQSAKQAAGASGLLIGAAVLAFLAFVFALVAGAYGLVAAGLPVWAGFLIVAGILLLVADHPRAGRQVAHEAHHAPAACHRRGREDQGVPVRDHRLGQARLRPGPRHRQRSHRPHAVTLLDPEEVVRVEGPWTHRDVPANGSRFHVAEMGEGPLVLLLHGFPTFWWTWRHALPVLAEAGYHAAAMDLRGYAGSDHPPRGYDPFTLSADVSGVIRSLGVARRRRRGTWMGRVPGVDGRRHAPRGDPRRSPRCRCRTPAGCGPPCWATPDSAAPRPTPSASRCRPPPSVTCSRTAPPRWGDLLRAWSATPSWPDDHTAATYRAAMLLLNTAHCALEYHRWALRSVPRPDGIRYAKRMKAPITAPVLHIQGAADPTVLPSSARGSGDYVTGRYEYAEIPVSRALPARGAPRGVPRDAAGLAGRI